jgi:uncharacterized protein (TIGR03066 family)
MKHNKHAVKHRKASPMPQQARKPEKASKAQLLLPRWAIIVLCLVLACGGTVAFCEYFVFAKIPTELVGKWVVQGGPQDGSTFDFSRNGTLEAHINAQGYDHPLNATIAVDDKQMRITTRNPHTNQDETRTCLIRELTADSLIVEFEQNETFKMVRVK